MAVTNYHVVSDALIGETTSGIRIDYICDALGSTTATVNDSAAIVNTYRYKPYGSELSKAGVGADPMYRWNGKTVSREATPPFSSHYNRLRHYGCAPARWTTVDPLWPHSPGHAYSLCNPTTFNDPFGLIQQPTKGEIIGISPGGVTTLCVPGGPPGKTTCSLDRYAPGFGTVFIRICSSLCERDCTIVHEQVHLNQMAQCGTLASMCARKYGSVKCQGVFNDWFASNRDAFECAAYRASCNCFVLSYPPLLEWSCCDAELLNGIHYDCQQVAALCGSAKDVRPCPFTSKGDILI